MWIIVELMENENTMALIKSTVTKNKELIKKLMKKGKGTKGLEMIIKALQKK